MKRIERTFAIIGAALLLLLGSAVATQAGNGSALKFGKINKGTKTTTLQVTSGTASPLKLQGSATSAPLVTNMKGQVANLNASMVGGATLVPKLFRMPTPFVAATNYGIAGVAAGTYLVTVAANAHVATDEMACWLYDSTNGQIIVEMHTLGSPAYFESPSAATVANLTGSAMNFICNAGSDISVPSGGFYTGFAPTVSLVPLPSTSIVTLSPATIPAAGAPLGGLQ